MRLSAFYFLLRALSRLIQAPFQCIAKPCSNFLDILRFRILRSDRSVLGQVPKGDAGPIIGLILVYVDDILIISSALEKAEQEILLISSTFHITDQGYI